MLERIKVYGEVIKFEHTLFSLPFAYTGGILAVQGLLTFHQWLWITMAVIGARSAGMAWNRLLDRKIDANNPRSAGRALPQKRVTILEVIIWICLSLGLLIIASWQLNPLCLSLAPIAILSILFYSLTKRFTWFSHLFLGVVLGLAPVGSWLAVRGKMALEPLLLGLGVTFWTAGFDIIYATMDLEFDRQAGLYSVPVRFGLDRALEISLGLHALAFFFFSLLKFAAGLGWLYLLALGVVAFLLYKENQVVSPEDLSRVNLAFFQINSLVSLTILTFVLLEFGL